MLMKTHRYSWVSTWNFRGAVACARCTITFILKSTIPHSMFSRLEHYTSKSSVLRCPRQETIHGEKWGNHKLLSPWNFLHYRMILHLMKFCLGSPEIWPLCTESWGKFERCSCEIFKTLLQHTIGFTRHRDVEVPILEYLGWVQSRHKPDSGARNGSQNAARGLYNQFSYWNRW